MKHKFRSMGRVAIALVLALSLCLMMAVPVSAEEPTISLDEEWYGIGDTVNVTVVDATENVSVPVTDELATPWPDAAELVFTVAQDIIVDPAETAVAKDQAGTTLDLHATPHPNPKEVQLALAPATEIKYIDAADISGTGPYDLDIGEQPYQPLNSGDLAGQRLSVSLFEEPVGGETVTVTLGLINAAGGGYIFEYQFVNLGTTLVEVPGTVGSIDYVQVTPSAAQVDQTLTLSSTNAVWVSYEYHVVDTVEVTATSPSDDPLTLELTENGVNTGEFGGSFDLVAAAPDPGELLVAHGDTITVTYGAEVDTAEVDAEAPTITSLTPVQDEFVTTATPYISAVLADPDSELNETTIALTVDGTLLLNTDYDFNSETGLLDFTPGEGMSLVSLDEGACPVIAAVDDNVGNSGSETWTFVVDTVPPTAPTGLTATTMPKRIDLTWDIVGAEGGSPIDHYNIYRNTSEGVTIPDDYLDSSDTNLYKDATGEDGVTYYYVVTAVDEATNEGAASIEASAIFSAEYVIQTFASGLIGGWNYISLPIIPINPDITVVLDSVDGQYSEVWAYEGQQWQVYIPGEPDDYYTILGLTKLENMVDGLGYIVNMIEPASWTGTGIDEQPGALVPPCYAVAEGWNLIGFKTMDFNGDDVISQANDSVTASVYLVTLDPPDGITFLRFFARDEVTFKEVKASLASHDMLICHGYWLYIMTEGEIVPPIVQPPQG